MREYIYTLDSSCTSGNILGTFVTKMAMTISRNFIYSFFWKVDIEIRVARLFGSQIMLTFMPCILLQVIGLCVFAIPLDDLSDRLTVSISCLIVMAALFSQVWNPEHGYFSFAPWNWSWGYSRVLKRYEVMKSNFMYI